MMMEIIFICDIKISAVVKSSTWLSKYKLSSHLETTKKQRDFRNILWIPSLALTQ